MSESAIHNRDRLMARVGARLEKHAKTLRKALSHPDDETRRRELVALSRALAGTGRELQWLATGKLDEPRRRRLNLVRVAGRVIREWNGFAGAGAIRLEADAPSLLGSWDPHHLGSLLGELISNALKFHGGQPVLVVVAARDARTVSMVVESAGDGPLPARPFERFSRGPHARGEGMGVGTWLVDTIARANGGALRFKRAKNGGVRAEVVLATEAGGRRRASVR